MGWSLYESGTTSGTKREKKNNEPVDARDPAGNKERCDSGEEPQRAGHGRAATKLAWGRAWNGMGRRGRKSR